MLITDHATQEMMDKNLKNATILIVDDNISNVELLEGILEIEGYVNIRSTTDPRQVIDLYESFQPDLILLDLLMPYLSGFEVMEQLKKIVISKVFIPILVLTADISQEVKQRALSSGAKDFLSKPFDLAEVVIRIKNLLETRYLHQLCEKQNHTLALKVKERTRELEKAYREIMQVNQELELLDKAKLEFLNIIGHEIRTPLNGIKGFTDILKNRIESPQLLELVQYLESSAERLEKFSLQALLISELRTKIYILDYENVSILMLIESAKKNLKTKIAKKNIQIEYVKDADLSSVKADLRLIKICFESLIDNAIKYSPENAVIIINAYSDIRFTTIEFTDHGVGFSAVALKNIFRFFSVGHKHIDQNPGLDIALVKLIMDAHHGEIKVMNNKPNGATVKLIFKNK